jgi:hypothetical protein
MPWPSSTELGHHGEPGDGGSLGAGPLPASAELSAELLPRGGAIRPNRGWPQQTGERNSGAALTPRAAVSVRGWPRARAGPAERPPLPCTACGWLGSAEVMGSGVVCATRAGAGGGADAVAPGVAVAGRAGGKEALPGCAFVGGGAGFGSCDGVLSTGRAGCLPAGGASVGFVTGVLPVPGPKGCPICDARGWAPARTPAASA